MCKGCGVLAFVAQRAHAGYDHIYAFGLKAVGEREAWQGGFNAKDAATNAAGGVGVVGGNGRCDTLINCRQVVWAIFLLATAVVEAVQQPMFFKKHQGAEDGAAVDGAEEEKEFLEREGGSKLFYSF